MQHYQKKAKQSSQCGNGILKMVPLHFSQKCHMLFSKATRHVWPAQGVIEFSSQAQSLSLCPQNMRLACERHASLTYSSFACFFINAGEEIAIYPVPLQPCGSLCHKACWDKASPGGMKSLNPLKPAAADRPARWRSNQETSSGRLAV